MPSRVCTIRITGSEWLSAEVINEVLAKKFHWFGDLMACPEDPNAMAVCVDVESFDELFMHTSFRVYGKVTVHGYVPWALASSNV